MKTIIDFYKSSVGKKLIVGLTGMFLCVYLVVHLVGNLLLFKGDGGAAFNTYAEILPNLLIIRVIEIVLFAVFIGHILTAAIIWLMNKRSRPHNYEMKKPEENSSLTSRTTFLSGSIIFIFLVVHMKSFWYPSRFHLEENPAMYKLVAIVFSNPLYDGFYVVAMFFLGFHLRHGFQSAFQTFGLRTQRYVPLIEFVGVLFWLVIPALFAAMPVYFLLNS